MNTINQPLPKKPYIFSEETMQALRELGDVLRDIHKRLLSEGYIIKRGKIIPPNPYEHINSNDRS